MRTRPKEDLPYYKGPQARRPIKSTMQPNRNTNRSLGNQKQKIGWLYGSNEELNRSGSEADEFENQKPQVGWVYDSNKLKRSDSESDDDFENRSKFRGSEHGDRKNGENSYYKSGTGKLLYKTQVGDLNKINKHEAHSPRQNTVGSSEEKYQDYKLYIAIPILISVIIFYLMNVNGEEATSVGNKEHLRDEMKNIRSEFPSQDDDIWYTFSSGIKSVEGDPSQPSVILILHDRGDDTPTCLAVKVAKAAMKFLNSTKSSPYMLDGMKLGKNKALINDYGEFIAEGKLKIEEYRTMIVTNLHKVPGKVAQSFHSFCDTYTPLVDKAVYLFTLEAVGASNDSHPTALAEKELEQRWKKELHEDKLKPLITRITDNVVVVKSEENLASSCENMVKSGYS